MSAEATLLVASKINLNQLNQVRPSTKGRLGGGFGLGVCGGDCPGAMISYLSSFHSSYSSCKPEESDLSTATSAPLRRATSKQKRRVLPVEETSRKGYSMRGSV
jgi:hypothetical protein